MEAEPALLDIMLKYIVLVQNLFFACCIDCIDSGRLCRLGGGMPSGLHGLPLFAAPVMVCS